MFRYLINYSPDDGQGSGGSEPEGTSTPPIVSLEDIIKENPGLQDQIDAFADRRVAEAEARVKGAAAEQVSAAERLAALEGEERIAEQERMRIEDLERRERAVELGEMRSTAAGILSQRNLPSTLLDSVDFTSAETVQSSIKSLEAAFTEAVKSRVKELAKSTVVPGAAAANNPKDPVSADVQRWEKKLNLDN